MRLPNVRTAISDILPMAVRPTATTVHSGFRGACLSGPVHGIAPAMAMVVAGMVAGMVKDGGATTAWESVAIGGADVEISRAIAWATAGISAEAEFSAAPEAEVIITVADNVSAAPGNLRLHFQVISKTKRL